MSTLSLLPSKLASRRRTKRVGDLAVLPVFYRLKGRKVVLAGGTDAAAWKGELLAAAGAIVHIYAEQLDPAFDEVISNSPASFVRHQRPWAADSFENAVVAIGDANSDGEAHAFYCAAIAAGVAVNVIDRPAYCQFQFGSIVNRSPAIVGISTDGAAPIFGQAIRRRIETVFPPALQGWAKLAQTIRPRVNETLESGAPRRRFWETFVDRAFSGEDASKAKGGLARNFSKWKADPNPPGGRVTLVGAGPGDSELLTLKAVRALQAADVILFDNLVSDEVLELARREAKRMLVGKRGGRASCKQEDINEMLVKLAKAGKNVVRLKSGDPMIFGRGGEEIAHLEGHGIPVAIVPGVTSATAMAAQLGVSLTHRDCAQSVRFVTGHSRMGELPDDIDWTAIADPNSTTVFYMGGRTAKQIGQTLRENGLCASTPAAICSSVSRANAKTWTGTLDNVTEGISEIGYDQPVLLAVGKVLRKAEYQDCANPISLRAS